MYYVPLINMMIYVAVIELGAWTPKEYIFGPEIKWNDEF